MIPLRSDVPARRPAVVTLALVAANVAVSLFALALWLEPGQRAEGARLFEAFLLEFGLVPCRVGHACPSRLSTVMAGAPAPWVTVFTSMFLHGGLVHLGGNMLYLWIFGPGVEEALGRGRLLAFYLVCGVAAALAQYAQDPVAAVPMVGASGAVSGILGAYLVLYPRARIATLVVFGFYWRLVRVPALAILGLWIAVQVVSGLLTFGRDGGGVAFLAHVGGFLAGLGLVHVFRPKPPPSPYRWGHEPL